MSTNGRVFIAFKAIDNHLSVSSLLLCFTQKPPVGFWEHKIRPVTPPSITNIHFSALRQKKRKKENRIMKRSSKGTFHHLSSADVNIIKAQTFTRHTRFTKGWGGSVGPLGWGSGRDATPYGSLSSVKEWSQRGLMTGISLSRFQC